MVLYLAHYIWHVLVAGQVFIPVDNLAMRKALSLKTSFANDPPVTHFTKGTLVFLI